jgi:hypothetical protein
MKTFPVFRENTELMSGISRVIAEVVAYDQTAGLFA